LLSYSSLAPLNAILNSIAAVLLTAGFVFIKRKNVAAHRACMISALVVSAAFLTSYLLYHLHVGDVRFGGTGWVRPLYFTILVPHVILAGVIVPLALTTLYFALRGRFPSHRRIARWTWPLWIYVSVTGVVIYVMLYRLYPPIMP
jgi:putative membrane protein